MDTSLKLYFEDSQGTVYNFPYAMQQAELFDFTVNKTRMGSAPTITATLEYPSCLDSEWEQWCHFDDIFVVFNNERYYLKATPASSKSNDKLFYKHDLTFVSERTVLETVYMIDDLENQTHNIILSNNTQITFFGDIAQFVERINQSMYFSGIGDTCVYDTSTTPPTINPLPRTPNGDGFYVVVDSSVTTTDEVLVTLSNNTIADALKQLFEKWGVPYYFTGRIIHVGDYEQIVDADYAVGGVLGADVENGVLVPYEYGHPNSVLKVSRSNGTKQIYNRCSGTGSSDNIPYYYPNPTPSGTIHHEVTAQQGSTLTDDRVAIGNMLKFSNLGNGDALEYIESPLELDGGIGRKDYYFNGEVVPFQSEGGLLPIVLPVPMPFTYNIRRDPNSGNNPWYFILPTNANVAVKVTLQKPFHKLVFDFSTFCEEDVYWFFSNEDHSVYLSGIGNSMEYDGVPLRTGVYHFSFLKTIQPPTDQSVSINQLDELMHTEINIQPLVLDADGWHGFYGEEEYYWSLRSTGARVNLSDYGIVLASDVTLANGDLIEKVIDKWVPPQEKLMPSCYRISDGKKRFYPARNYPLYDTTDYDPDLGDDDSIGDYINNDNYLDEDGVYYHFDNPYRKLKQKEHIYDFPEIKPTIEGMRAPGYGNRRLDMFENIDFDTNDNNEGYIDEQGNFNFNHPYFFAQLRPTGYNFNLFEQSIDEGKMTIAMTSGDCAPCEFEIMVDKNTQKNLVQVDSNGNLIRDEDGDVICGRKEAVSPMPSQQQTRNHRVWIALKKDIETFGGSSVMPFNDGVVQIRPRPCTDEYSDDGDTFVILHIEMPQSYIENAEQRLTEAIIKQMNIDNIEKFNMSLMYDRVYLGKNQSLVNVLSENVKVSARYNGVTKQFFVSSYSYRMQNSSPIPEINITGLVETVEELSSVARSTGVGFMQRIGEHIAENFGELMIGANKPFTRIINQNNYSVANQIRNDFPSDYVSSQDELMKYCIVMGNGGKKVVNILPGEEGQVLSMENGIPIWKDSEGGSIEVEGNDGDVIVSDGDMGIVANSNVNISSSGSITANGSITGYQINARGALTGIAVNTIGNVSANGYVVSYSYFLLKDTANDNMYRIEITNGQLVISQEI